MVFSSRVFVLIHTSPIRITLIEFPKQHKAWRREAIWKLLCILGKQKVVFCFFCLLCWLLGQLLHRARIVWGGPGVFVKMAVRHISDPPGMLTTDKRSTFFRKQNFKSTGNLLLDISADIFFKFLLFRIFFALEHQPQH